MPGHFCIHRNEQADVLCRSAVELEGAWSLRRDLQSCLSAVKSSVLLLWQSQWVSQHLNTIKPVLSEYATRLRTDCTRATHMLQFISHSFPPQNHHCNVTLTVDHMLVHCMCYWEARRSLTAYWVARRPLATGHPVW